MRLLFVECRFYPAISDLLRAGAAGEGVAYDSVIVPGALEAPAAVSWGIDSGRYDGFVVLGCIIRGETFHFDVVARESARGLSELAVRRGAAIGNGILTVENEAQALVRADPAQGNKGGGAVWAALALIAARKQLLGEVGA